MLRKFRAPGRVNLIGEHTDYNDGFVLPAALGFATVATVTPRRDGRLRVSSETQEGGLDIGVEEELRPQGEWTDYVSGVVQQLRLAGIATPAAEIRITSDVPQGAGLSSSAALEVSSALALLGMAGRSLPPMEIARLCQAAEIAFTGTRCGIMDQFISLHGQAHCAMLLDCRSLEFRAVEIPAGVALVVANTMVKHELSGSEYNDRRADCEEAAAKLGLSSLRDAKEVPPSEERIWRRARHVIGENARVLRFVEAISQGQLREAGALMEESHRSLRDDYEVSCPELDVMVELARKLPGYWGGRMTGGGFGGCTINLVESEQAQGFREALRERYAAATGIEADIYVTQAGAGAGEIL